MSLSTIDADELLSLSPSAQKSYLAERSDELKRVMAESQREQRQFDAALAEFAREMSTITQLAQLNNWRSIANMRFPGQFPSPIPGMILEAGERLKKNCGI
jgi:hypothetical protein